MIQILKRMFMMAVSLCCWKIWLVLITLTILDTLITRVSMTYSSPSGTGSRFIRRQSLDGFVAPGPSVAVYPRVASVVYCAAMCSADTECMSFFYKPLTATCDLRNDIISVGVTGNADPGSIYFHLDTICLGIPDIISNGQPLLNTSKTVWVVGDVIPVTCDPEHVFYGQLVCKGGNKWNIPACEIPSCAALKACDVSARDGEYWLFPAILQGERVKVYCSNMTSSTPKEYITLKGSNNGQSPDLSNLNCLGETPSIKPLMVGESSYSKIRIDLATMEVDTLDVAFANITSGDPWPYGTTRDCYAIHYDGDSHCGGPRGTFIINTTSTGLAVKSTVTWKVFGWHPYQIVERSPSGSVISLRCGGWEGGCEPDGPLLLELNPDEDLPEDSASFSQC